MELHDGSETAVLACPKCALSPEERARRKDLRHLEGCPKRGKGGRPRKVKKPAKPLLPIEEGRKKVGRPLGSGNRLTTKVREAIASVFDQLGGERGFAEWAREHPTEFYKLFARSAPKESELLNRAAGVTVVVGSASDIRADRDRHVIEVETGK